MIENELKLAIKAIKAAKKLGVVSMKLGSIEFELEPQDGSTRVRRTTSKASAKKIAENEKETKLQLELQEIKSDLSTMHVEDPLGFEQGIIENVIGDGGDSIEKLETEDAHIS